MDPKETWEAWLASVACITQPRPGSKTLDRRTGEQFILKLSSETIQQFNINITINVIITNLATLPR